MICPNCGHDNLPGSEECGKCLQDLTQLDRPIAQNRVERGLMEDPVLAMRPHKPISLSQSATIAEAVQKMLEGNVGALLIVDDNGLLSGIFTERDLLTRVIGIHDNFDALSVRQFMTANPEAVTSKDTLAFALHKMDGGGYRHLPVVDDGKPTGVISVRDMLRHITKLCKES